MADVIWLSSDSLPPISHIDLLPPELLTKIFDYTVSNREGKRFYHQRQTTLRSLCLTSRRFRSIAQPLLLAHVGMYNGTNFGFLKLLLDKNPLSALVAVRKIHLSNFKVTSPFFDRLYAFPRFATGLRELSVDLGLALVPFLGCNITTLSLNWVKIYKLPHFHFPQVKYLYLDSCSFHGGGHTAEPASLPSLQHLVYLAPPSRDPSLEASYLSYIATKLASVTVRLGSRSHLPAIIASNPSISLCIDAIHTERTSLAGVQVLRLVTSGMVYTADIGEVALKEWIELIKHADDLRHLIVPSEVNRLKFLPPFQAVFDELMGLCERRPIKVTRESFRTGKGFWEYVSPTFIRDSEERRRTLLASNEG